MLLSKGSDVVAASSNGMNALHMACEAARIETVRALMEFVQSDEEKKSILTMAKTSEDKTAWDIAAGAKNKAICVILKELGDLNGASSSCVIS